MRGSPTRRRLLALLSSLPIIAMQSDGAEQRRASRADTVSNADPVPRLFAEFQALLDRHVAAIVNRDGIEAALVDRIGWPRVALPGGSGRVRRHAAGAATIERAVPRDRCRQCLVQCLRRRQRRWDAAAMKVGLLQVKLH
ncbi:hypothetical protein FHR71_002476 [Methylobacterium sp. RAS18]|nr:hypothetical protein [Methylobacterium sp. RAS18]